jgi:hypothetical protein
MPAGESNGLMQLGGDFISTQQGPFKDECRELFGELIEERMG